MSLRSRATYPIKVYLTNNDSVVMSYANNFYVSDFEVEDISCLIPKSDFYNMLKKLNEIGNIKISYGDKSIQINDQKTYTKIIVSNGMKEEVIIEKERGFLEWLLSIDLRKAERIEKIIPISIENEEIFGYGQSLDISSSGFKITTNIELCENEKININIFDKSYPISSCLCDVRYKKEEKDEFIYGLRILDITIENLYNLDHLVSNTNNA